MEVLAATDGEGGDGVVCRCFGDEVAEGTSAFLGEVFGEGLQDS